MGAGLDLSTGGHIVTDISAQPVHSRALAPSQRRYGDYFISVLSSPELSTQEHLTKVIRQVSRALVSSLPRPFFCCRSRTDIYLGK